MSASPVLSSICFLTYAIPRQVSGLLLSAYRLTIFGYFFSCTVAYRLHLNPTTVYIFTIAPRIGVVNPSQQPRIVVQVFGQHHPADPRHLVGNRKHRLMATAARCNLARPTAERIFFILRLSRPQYCTSAVNQHGAQITVATLGDAKQDRFATGTVLPRGQSQPRRHHSSTLECLTITECCHKTARHDRPESWNLHQPTHWL